MTNNGQIRFATSDLPVSHPENREFVPVPRPRAPDDRSPVARDTAVVHGHPHIPRTIHYDGVRFAEIPVGCPRERHRRGACAATGLRQMLPELAR